MTQNISVAFGKEESAFEKCPDRITAESSFSILNEIFPRVTLELHRINILKSEMEHNRARIKRLINPLKSVLDDSIGSALWYASQGWDDSFRTF